MNETREYWENCLAEFEEALALEKTMENPNDDMLRLLSKEIEYCKGVLS
jgi:hypothetical protein